MDDTLCTISTPANDEGFEITSDCLQSATLRRCVWTDFNGCFMNCQKDTRICGGCGWPPGSRTFSVFYARVGDVCLLATLRKTPILILNILKRFSLLVIKLLKRVCLKYAKTCSFHLILKWIERLVEPNESKVQTYLINTLADIIQCVNHWHITYPWRLRISLM